MKLGETFGFEFAYQTRRVQAWLFFGVLVVVAFLMTRDASLAEALREDFFVNSPFAIAKTTVFVSLVWLLIAASVAGEAAARDVATGMHPLCYTAPTSKSDYLGGRFLAAFALNALILLAVPMGGLLAVNLPGVDPEAVGPCRPAAYLGAYFFIALPNAFAATAVQFSLAVRSGRPMAAYLGGVLLFFMSWIVAGIVSVPLGRPEVGRMLDAIGAFNIITDLSLGWTPDEKRLRLIGLEGAFLWNRLLWLGIGLTALTFTYSRFEFAHRTTTSWWSRIRRPGAKARTPIDMVRTAPIAVPQVQRRFGVATSARQTLAIARSSFGAIVRSWAGRVSLVVIPALALAIVFQETQVNGVPLEATTARVVNLLTAPLGAEMTPWIIIPLVLTLYAGQLVWQERVVGLDQITGAMPGSEWVPLLGKLLGLGLLLVTWMSFLMMAGVLGQTILGHPNIEIGLYLQTFFGLQVSDYLLFAVLALVVHVVVNQRYIGHLVVIIAYVFIAVPWVFGVEHSLLVYGTGPVWSYTEMQGFGVSVGPWLWFKLYWAAWAALLAVVARLFWVRGTERSAKVRLHVAGRRLDAPTARAAVVALALIVTVGGFVFYNTNVLNDYLTASDLAKRSARYERLYGRYADSPKPRPTAANLLVEIHPEGREVEIRGSYRLVNSGAVAIDSIHVAPVLGVATRNITIDRPAALVLADEGLNHHIYALDRSLQPGDSLEVRFDVRVEQRGFTQNGIDPSVVANGTYFANEWLPGIGYQRSRELTSPNDRREHGLAPRPLIPSLYDEAARQSWANRIAFDAVVGTTADQTAVAPGVLRRTWTGGGRQYFQYATDAPIGGEWRFFSADYAVHEAEWGQAKTIRIYHHPTHTANLDRIVRSVQASLEYYTNQFGPYPHGHLSIVERPGHGVGMSANASMLSFEEGFAAWKPTENLEDVDFPFAVVAHEVAHQWFGAQLPYAFVEGAPVLSESLSWYAAIQAVEGAFGREQQQQLLSLMRRPHPFPPIRRGVPLIRALDPYLAYRKGPFALHALAGYVGEGRVNLALRRLVEKHRSGAPPLPTTLDLYRELQAVTPDSLQRLLHDLFQVNTIWDFQMQRATATAIDEGSWEVTLDVRADKVVADSAGVETEVPIDDWVEIGIFGRADHGGELSVPLYLEKHRISARAQTITVTVPRRPFLAGIDPHHLLDFVEQSDDDNIEPVEADE